MTHPYLKGLAPTIRACADCAKPISKDAQRCNPCHLKTVARPGRKPKPYTPRFCACGTQVARRNTSGRCKSCTLVWLNTDPEAKAKRVQGLHRMMALRPEWADKIRALGRAPKSAEHREAARRSAKERRLWEYGLPASQTPEANAKRGRGITERMLGWCPPELRDDYRKLVRNYGYKAAEARELILERHEAEMARFRRKCMEAAA